ncbi:MAG TPA: dehydrogenase E1 component subunit alpha/beta [Armatimonadota bacterium]|nr:pyruvate dehydrogenase [Armatimonadota bacterium]HOJ20557.1 dehydrogenase E1 component subunit alpha/beta [Armatimonadota bacterium]HOM80165.1 dehydrogenase E1 component subunit alpha/beta [Armatimonadota bacterium]HPO71589.1 dehydrogenase E1 component subunit alpha/beta [Armatimonadota bacterium]HPT97705.1 dehydrogenase E1 component subunit alpha/beta [Armatimonadota bacterium]
MRELDVMPRCEPETLRFGEIPKCRYSGTLRAEIEAGRITPQAAREMLETMFLVRAFEALIVDMKNNKFSPAPGFKFIGASHLSIGQEAVAVGVMAATRGDDYITSTHRGHGHSIAKGVYALRAMDAEQLKNWLGDPNAQGTREELLQRALKTHLYKTVAELFGKEDGYCRGRGGGMHIADFHLGHLGANAIVGGSSAIAAGAALAAQRLGEGKICVGIVGDGATNNGIFHEACNFAAQDQFKKGIPLLFVIENNQYGMTGQQAGEVTGVDYLARRGAAYNKEMMHAEVVDGMNVLAVWDAVLRGAALCRSDQGPVLLEALCYRYYGHSLSDNRTTYRTPEEEEAWRNNDPIARFSREVVAAGVMTQAEVAAMEQACTDAMRQAAIDAAASADPDPAQIEEGLFSNTMCDEVPARFKHTKLVGELRRARRDGQGRILYRHAIAEALAEEMLRDERVIFYGEDVADYGGAFQATVGLLAAFGRDRVFNAPISEACIVGTAVGAAMVGLRPVCEIMYIDFMGLTMDQTGNQAAKVRYMFGGKALVPMVVRTTVGGGKGYAGQHSQSLEAMCTMFPGLKVVMPSTAYDAKGLLKTAIRDNDPVIFIEHQLLYTERGVVPEEEYLVPFGQAAIRREGKDLTIVAYSRMVDVALEAAEMLAAEGIQAEVIDPRTLIPFDYDAVTASVEKTGRALLLCQAPETGCFAEHIAYQTQKRAWKSLKAPVRIVAAYNVPPPMSAVLEMENLPDAAKVVRNARELLAE